MVSQTVREFSVDYIPLHGVLHLFKVVNQEGSARRLQVVQCVELTVQPLKFKNKEKESTYTQKITIKPLHENLIESFLNAENTTERL